MDRSIVKATSNVLVFGILCWHSAAATAQEQADQAAEPNTGNISLSAGFDVTTEYLFRGIFQEDQGAIVQPWFEIGVDLFKSDGPIRSAALTFGLWNSLHSGPSGSGSGGPGGWWWSWWSVVVLVIPVVRGGPGCRWWSWWSRW